MKKGVSKRPEPVSHSPGSHIPVSFILDFANDKAIPRKATPQLPDIPRDAQVEGSKGK